MKHPDWGSWFMIIIVVLCFCFPFVDLQDHVLFFISILRPFGFTAGALSLQAVSAFHRLLPRTFPVVLVFRSPGSLLSPLPELRRRLVCLSVGHVPSSRRRQGMRLRLH